MELEKLLGKNVLYRKVGGTGYGKVVRETTDFDPYNVVVDIKIENETKQAVVNLKDIIKVYGN